MEENLVLSFEKTFKMSCISQNFRRIMQVSRYRCFVPFICLAIPKFKKKKECFAFAMHHFYILKFLCLAGYIMYFQIWNR